MVAAWREGGARRGAEGGLYLDYRAIELDVYEAYLFYFYAPCKRQVN
jgi:hypothetical protein